KRRELFALAPGQGQEPQKKQQANNRNGQIICSQSGQFDMSSTPELQAGWRIRRVIEAVRCCQAFARELAAGEERSLAFAFRWTGLQGRRLYRSVSFPQLRLPQFSCGPYQEDKLPLRADLASEAGPNAILEAAREALTPLFALVGAELEREQLEEIWSRFF
ncbi:MAG: hypothetical protein PHO89_10615, partial [Methylacidiphilaceae bacterium]|nr:hypothetical protein [Candidatus Methylacidiphilaceae bacterium]